MDLNSCSLTRSFPQWLYCRSLQSDTFMQQKSKKGIIKKIHGSIEKSKYTKMKLSRDLIPRTITHGPRTRTDIGIDHFSHKISQFSGAKSNIFSPWKLWYLGGKMVDTDIGMSVPTMIDCVPNQVPTKLHFGITLFRFLYRPLDFFIILFFDFCCIKVSLCKDLQ